MADANEEKKLVIQVKDGEDIDYKYDDMNDGQQVLFMKVESIRNKGFGKLIIEDFLKRSQKPIILEVELPDSNIRERRIKFYKRLGFHLNPHFYEIQSVHEGFSALEFLIMSFPHTISENDVSNFVKKCHPIIFKD